MITGNSKFSFVSALCILGFCVFWGGIHAPAQMANLVTNASFETGGTSIAQDYNQNGWTFFVIEEPVKGAVLNSGAQDGNACFEIQTEDGRGFLHSDPFSVKPSSRLKLSAWIKGSGEGAIEVLWWKKYDDDTVIESNHHRDVLKTFNASSSWEEVTAVAAVPEDAKFAYIRLVASKAAVCFDNISATQ